VDKGLPILTQSVIGSSFRLYFGSHHSLPAICLMHRMVSNRADDLCTVTSSISIIQPQRIIRLERGASSFGRRPHGSGDHDLLLACWLNQNDGL
jgi:hypothetical protein